MESSKSEHKPCIFVGSSNKSLSDLITKKLGIPPSEIEIKKNACEEISVEIKNSIRDKNVYIIQSCSDSINNDIMELLIMINACKTSSAATVTAVIPYFPYGKQSKMKKSRTAITAKLISNILICSGVDHVITMDLHSSVMQGFFNVPVDNLFSEPTIAKYIKENIPEYTNGIVVSKNAGGAIRVTSLADQLNLGFAMIEKKNNRDHATVIGDVKGKICFIMDDIIDSPNAFLTAAQVLHENEAQKIYIVATHGLFSNDALEKIEQCDYVDAVFTTNSYDIPEEKLKQSTKLNIIDISSVLAEAIDRTFTGKSVSYLFNHSV
ncbi:ribose-phosphate pyrophosphokinase 1-like protein [Anaeromyces robustus]|uniref:ribose-phosphate diphosphokinase n=1 Tax=Anaeromyces robustus TaxID=1754192 RepID=A0A1Y1X1C7_9FUNG|nr:ribose-phosphate pyrophosphokinase 1-like protein [Anaeromyces robustus]|eukprot:ORX79144.1 ribose-phosphate pyrophosphokinase 1-like protein [Anaeromyces robustus]